jgi:hypothetical protein
LELTELSNRNIAIEILGSEFATNRSINPTLTMFRLIIALALVASASANACKDAGFPALVSTDCTTDTGILSGPTCMTSSTVTEAGGDKYTVSVAMCYPADTCETLKASDPTVACVADSTACMVGSSCSGAGALQISTFAVMFSLIAAFYQL